MLAALFLGEQLTNGGNSLTPEECLVLWRARHPLQHFPVADKNDSASGRTALGAIRLAGATGGDQRDYCETNNGAHTSSSICHPVSLTGSSTDSLARTVL